MQQGYRFVMRVALIATALGVLVAANAAAASGYDGLEPRESGYTSGLHPDWSVGDMTFGATPGGSLTDGEKFTLFGARETSAGESGRGPYWSMVADYASRFYSQFGYIPQRLTPEVMGQSYNCEPEELGSFVVGDGLKSPVSGEYPRLNSEEFTPGGFHIRELTYSEKVLLASKNQMYRRCWFEGKYTSAVSGEEMQVSCGPVLYVRVYGERDVLLEQIHFMLTPVNQ